MTFPDDCVQSIIGSEPWWVKHAEKQICRGTLLKAFLPHVDQVPYAFTPKGRTSATEHDKADMTVEPLKIGQRIATTPLPVAAMPTYPGEVWAAYRAKTRPCLVLGCGSLPVESTLTRGMVNHASAPTYVVAPYYGALRKTNRVGYNKTFVEHIRHCAFPQFIWDILPFAGGEESILRLDQLQPIGAHPQSYEITGFRLSDAALIVVDEILNWLLWNGVPEDSLIAMYREEIEQLTAK